jgi:hypothetical protein
VAKVNKEYRDSKDSRSFVMSYCGFLQADAYIFMHVGGFLTCCGCPLPSEKGMEVHSFQANSTQEMLDHIDVHLESGHLIPSFVKERLIEDDEINFPISQDGV